MDKYLICEDFNLPQASASGWTLAHRHCFRGPKWSSSILFPDSSLAMPQREEDRQGWCWLGQSVEYTCAFEKKSHQLVALKIGSCQCTPTDGSWATSSPDAFEKKWSKACTTQDHIYSILEQSPRKHVFSPFTEHYYLCHMLRGNNCILSVTEYF